MNARIRNLLSLISNILLIVFVVYSLIWFFSPEGRSDGMGNMSVGGTRCLKFFTVDSNLLAAFAALLIIPFNLLGILKGKDRIPGFLIGLKMVVTYLIALGIRFLHNTFDKEGKLDMKKETFKVMHSDLIMEVQCIENDLKLIYSALKPEGLGDTNDGLEKASLGKILHELKEVDYSDGYPDLSERDYVLIDEIREIRNYWCHQCYVDYVYIKNSDEAESKFQEIADRLRFDESRTYDLHKKIEKIRIKKVKE